MMNVSARPLNIYNTGPERDKWRSWRIYELTEQRLFLTADWSMPIDAHLIKCCGELLLNFHGYNTMHDAIAYRTNKVLCDVSKITLHYINTKEQ